MHLHSVKILQKQYLSHNVICFALERPTSYTFTAGQALELNIEETKFENNAAPFTLSGLTDSATLEIIFRVYPDHKGMTLALSRLSEGDKLLISDAWDSFSYATEGVFIAGGTGITPFLSIMRNLNIAGQLEGNRLIFANKNLDDLFLKKELDEMLGNKVTYVFSRPPEGSIYRKRINKEFLKQNITNFNQSFYLCGPGSFSEDIATALEELGVKKESIHTEY